MAGLAAGVAGAAAPGAAANVLLVCPQPGSSASCPATSYTSIQGAVNAACKGGPRKCTTAQDLATLSANLTANIACALARARMTGDGWHIAVTHPGHTRMIFTGTVKASGDITAVRVRDERNDVVRTSGQTMQFHFANYGYIDGVDFTAQCAKWLGFSIQVDGRELSPTHVYLGYHGAHPLSDPFTVERH